MLEKVCSNLNVREPLPAVTIPGRYLSLQTMVETVGGVRLKLVGDDLSLFVCCQASKRGAKVPLSEIQCNICKLPMPIKKFNKLYNSEANKILVVNNALHCVVCYPSQEKQSTNLFT